MRTGSGNWQTRNYAGISGRLLVRLPDPLPENQDFEAEALVYYPIYSPWKTGQFVKMDFTGRYDPQSPASSSRNTNSIPGGSLKFKGTMGNQTVEYAAVVSGGQQRIVGAYLSSMPSDVGFFEITSP